MNNQSNPNTQGNVQRFEDSSMGMVERKIGNYVLHSAYAELAADRDLWRSMATFEGKVSASVLDDLHTTQAQLAELRGKLEERCVMLDGLAGVIRQYGLCAPMALEEVAKQIRALAAADGGADGH